MNAASRGTENVGSEPALFVDANGACTQQQAQALAEEFSEQNVTWFEEPVTSDNLEGLHFLRGRLPAGMDSQPANTITIASSAADVGGARGGRFAGRRHALRDHWVFEMAELADSFETPLSAHTAPAVHAHLWCAAPRARHVEYFHDHVRIEQMFFSGATTTRKKGFLSRPRRSPDSAWNQKTGRRHISNQFMKMQTPKMVSTLRARGGGRGGERR